MKARISKKNDMVLTLSPEEVNEVKYLIEMIGVYSMIYNELRTPVIAGKLYLTIAETIEAY